MLSASAVVAPNVIVTKFGGRCARERPSGRGRRDEVERAAESDVLGREAGLRLPQRVQARAPRATTPGKQDASTRPLRKISFTAGQSRRPVGSLQPAPRVSLRLRAVAAADERLETYARLAVQVGLNLQPGQTLGVNALIEHAPLARAIARQAYESGARYVDVLYSDQHVRRAHIAAAADDASGTRRPGS